MERERRRQHRLPLLQHQHRVQRDLGRRPGRAADADRGRALARRRAPSTTTATGAPSCRRTARRPSRCARPTRIRARLLLHPFGVLTVSQKIAPLDYAIDRFGNQKPTGDTTFASAGRAARPTTPREEFAVASFTTLSDDQKLSRTSFEQMKSGLRFGTGSGTVTGVGVDKDVSYERSYVHRSRGIVIRAGIVSILKSLFDMLARPARRHPEPALRRARAAWPQRPGARRGRHGRLPGRERQRPVARGRHDDGPQRGRGVRAARQAGARRPGAGRDAAGRRRPRALHGGRAMSLTVGKYTFNAWLRRGIGVHVNEADTLGAGGGAVKERATVPIDVQVNAPAGPQGLRAARARRRHRHQPRRVVRTEPRDWVTEFEPELPRLHRVLRGGPALALHAGARRRRPAAAVARAGGARGETTADGPASSPATPAQLPLPSITVASTASLPPQHADLGVGARPHQRRLPDRDRLRAVPRVARDARRPELRPHHLAARLPAAPEAEHGRTARSSCPRSRRAGWPGSGRTRRRSRPLTRSSRRGRRRPAASSSPSTTSGASAPARTRTSSRSSSGSCRAPPTRDVGIRPMDGEKPGWGLTSGTDIGQILPADEKQSVIGLEGALKAPTTQSRPSRGRYVSSVLRRSSQSDAQLPGACGARTPSAEPAGHHAADLRRVPRAARHGGRNAHRTGSTCSTAIRARVSRPASACASCRRTRRTTSRARGRRCRRSSPPTA